MVFVSLRLSLTQYLLSLASSRVVGIELFKEPPLASWPSAFYYSHLNGSVQDFLIVALESNNKSSQRHYCASLKALNCWAPEVHW